MALIDGTRFGAYEIVSLLGAGGMGEVYRARDMKLDRDVAIKVLPEIFVSDPERVARFQREAKTLAALNHPHIGGIYGLEDASGVHALVLELVEGPTLADRIGRGAIPLDEALPIARQIAEALEAAHEAGIIHRDLKPANLKLRPDGTVKVLDFGLAKALEPTTAASASVTASPTITTPAMMTGIGVILGTAAYMSPEQAKGRPADKRSDIWAFGCVLYEMLTGKRPFEGEDVSDTLAAVLRAEPDWSAWSADTPVPIRTLVRRCLTKDRRQRLQAIGEARIVIEEILTDKPSLEAAAAPTSDGQASPLAMTGWIAAAVLAAIAGIVFWTVLRQSPTPAPRVVRLVTPLAVSNVGSNLGGGEMALSRDGSCLAFVSGPTQQTHVRAMDQLDATPLPGTDGARFLAFSPDGQAISYISDRSAIRRLERDPPTPHGRRQLARRAEAGTMS